MKNKKYVFVGCNEKFMEIITLSFTGGLSGDPLGEDIYLEPLADYKTIGEAILRALAKSRDVSISEEDRQALIEKKVTYDWIYEKYPENELFTPIAAAERYKEWVKKAMMEYGYKTKKAFMQNMQRIDIEDDGENLLFSSSWHLTTDSWGNPDGKTPSVEFKIPSSSSAEIIGAAARYAIGNCRGKGADFMRDLLFPEGQPETFEKYVELLKIN